MRRFILSSLGCGIEYPQNSTSGLVNPGISTPLLINYNTVDLSVFFREQGGRNR
jgi:hypothetical protein